MPQVHTIPLRSSSHSVANREGGAAAFFWTGEANRCTPATLTWYETYIGALAAWLTEDHVADLAQVSPTHLREYLVDLGEARPSLIARSTTTQRGAGVLQLLP